MPKENYYKNSSYQPLFESFSFPNGTQAKNRIIMAPMTHMSSDPDGSISEQEIKYYARRANGVSMVITAATWVSEDGGITGGAGVERDSFIPGLSKLASAIQDQGALAVLQIFHGGRQSSRNGQFVSASNIPEDREGAVVPLELTEAKITEIIKAFGEAARRAIEAGFDGVEIHGANGNLLHQFFSPYTNRRSDLFGGTLQKRMAVALAIIEEVKRVVRAHGRKPFIVGFRLSPEEPETPGITMADTLLFVDALASRGLDYLHVSQKNFRSVPRRGVDDSRSRLAFIQKRVGQQLPVIGVGSIHNPKDAIEALQSGIQFIAIGRELIMEPDWTNLVIQGREVEINTTLSEKAQHQLSIPDPMWNLIMSVPGWFPVEMDNEK